MEEQNLPIGYAPSGKVPTDLDELAGYLYNELLQISAAIEQSRTGMVPKEFEAPEKPQEGLQKYADGTEWDPGEGAGMYYYDGLAWVKMNTTGVPAGAMLPYGGSAAPSGFLLCDGSAVSRATYAALFTAIGTAYGVGDGSTTFNLPDKRDNVSVGAGSSFSVGASGGNASVSIAQANLPNVTLDVDVTGFVTGGGTGSRLKAATDAKLAGTTVVRTFTTEALGSGTALSVQNPYEADNWIIKT